MSRIVAIRYFGKRPVYNMEVDGLHNFITAGGTVLHNCDALRYFAISRVFEAERTQAPVFDDDEDEDYDEFMTGGETPESYLAY